MSLGHRQCGVNEVAKVSKRRQVNLNSGPLDWQSGALTHFGSTYSQSNFGADKCSRTIKQLKVSHMRLVAEHFT